MRPRYDISKAYGILTVYVPDATPNGSGNGNSNYYIPVSSAPIQEAGSNNGTPATSSSLIVPSSTIEDSMHIDDTRNRIYIHNLDAEVAEIEASEPPTERLIFLPDIEKHFSRIPSQVLTNRRGSVDSNHEGQELVLYSVPKSLTLDEEQDSVRKAIGEARERARERAAEVEKARREEMERRYSHDAGDGEVVETAHGYGSGYGEPAQDDDPDAMDIE